MAKKGYTTGASLQPTLLFYATPFKSYCEARLYKTPLYCRRKHNGNYSPDIRKKVEGKKKIIQNTRNIPHFLYEYEEGKEILRKNSGTDKDWCEERRAHWTRDHRTPKAITFPTPTLTVHFQGISGGIEILYNFVFPIFAPFCASYVN